MYKVEIIRTRGIQLGFTRAYIATRMANSTIAWYQKLSTFKGSTYNSEYIVIDYKQFQTKSSISSCQTKSSISTSQAVMYIYDIPASRKDVAAGHQVKIGKGIMSINVPKDIYVYLMTRRCV